MWKMLQSEFIVLYYITLKVLYLMDFYKNSLNFKA